MKFLIALTLLSTVAFAASTSSNRILPVTKEDEAIRQEKMKAAKAQAAKSKIPGKAEEDCDDKAKKPIEITEESISLSGTAGCSLDDAH